MVTSFDAIVDEHVWSSVILHGFLRFCASLEMLFELGIGMLWLSWC